MKTESHVTYCLLVVLPPSEWDEVPYVAATW